MQDSHRQLIYVLIAVFTLLQLGVLVIFGYTPYPDSDGYIFLAEQCIDKGEPYPIVDKLNDYPFLWNIGAINAVTASLAIFHSIIPLLILYSLMKGMTALLFYAITKKICNHKVAFIALTLFLIYPANYGEGTSTLSELPFMCFMMLGMYFSLVHNQNFLGGMILAVGNWFRPMAIVFLLALIITMLFKWRKSIKLLLGYVVMVCAIGTITMSRTGLFLYQAKTGWMALADYSTNHDSISLAVRDHQEWDVNQKDSAWQTIFFDWLKDHPKEYFNQMPRKLINTYVSDNVNMCTFIPNKMDRDYLYDEVSMKTLINTFPRLSAVQWFTFLNLVVYFIFIIGAIASLFYFRCDAYLLPVSIITLGTLLLLFVGHGEARFHQPFMPFIIILSSLFIHKKLQ